MAIHDGELSERSILNCLNLEYYNQDIVGNDRILKAYAELTKGNWNLWKYHQAVELIKQDTLKHEEMYYDEELCNFFGIRVNVEK